MRFGQLFDQHYINQGFEENRTNDQTLDLGWRLLSTLPREELDRVDDKTLEQFYHPETAADTVPAAV